MCPLEQGMDSSPQENFTKKQYGENVDVDSSIMEHVLEMSIGE